MIPLIGKRQVLGQSVCSADEAAVHDGAARVRFDRCPFGLDAVVEIDLIVRP